MAREFNTHNSDFGNEVRKANHLIDEVLLWKDYSAHPDDDYLKVVLCSTCIGSKFATWIYNSDFKGCVFGHYFNDLDRAVNDFCERGVQ